MGTFNVTYADGTEAVETAPDCETADQFINMRFGSSFNDKCAVSVHGEEKLKIKSEAQAKAEAAHAAELAARASPPPVKLAPKTKK